MNDSTIPQKRCTTCQQFFPATSEYFTRSKSTKDGLYTKCKKCKQAKNRDWWKDNAKDISVRRKEAYPERREGRIKYHKEWRTKNRDKYLAKKRADYWADPEADQAKSRAWREAHPDWKKNYDKEYFEKHKPKIQLYKQEWAANNRPRINEKRRTQYAEDPHGRRLSGLKREARKRNLPDNFTVDDWQLCLSHFSGCAVCGAQEVLQADHWIPLANAECLGTVPHNMVPLCKSCNFSKQDAPARQWLEWKYGGEEGKRIFDKVTYFLSNEVRRIL